MRFSFFKIEESLKIAILACRSRSKQSKIVHFFSLVQLNALMSTNDLLASHNSIIGLSKSVVLFRKGVKFFILMTVLTTLVEALLQMSKFQLTSDRQKSHWYIEFRAKTATVFEPILYIVLCENFIRGPTKVSH